MLRGRAAIFAALLLCCASATLAVPSTRTLTFEDRVKAQEAIERVYYSHQIGAAKPFEEAVPREILEERVRTYLKQSVGLEEFWNTPVTADALRSELDRIVRNTRSPDRLREIYAVLGEDPILVQECFARPFLVDRLTRSFFAFDERFHGAARKEAEKLRQRLLRREIDILAEHPGRRVVRIALATKDDARGTRAGPGDGPPRPHVDSPLIELRPDEYGRWRGRLPSRVGEIGPVVEERGAFVVRVLVAEEAGQTTGSTYTFDKTPWDGWWAEVEARLDERDASQVALELEALPIPAPGCGGGQQDAGAVGQAAGTGHASQITSCAPDDTWDNGTLDDVPDGRRDHTAIWTGSVMVVWGGDSSTGGRYDPITDTWAPTSTSNAPAPRAHHSAVWTGDAVVVWGGTDGSWGLASGGKYDPAADTWTPTSETNAPDGRAYHTAVWTGSEMLVWGGANGSWRVGTGGRYDPVTDTWRPISAIDAPTARSNHTALWTGTEMVVWGGISGSGVWTEWVNTGGRYSPTTDTWLPTSIANAASPRSDHAAIWTGNTMIVWGGSYYFYPWNVRGDGGQYDPVADAWLPVSTTSAPAARSGHAAVWTGSLMAVWGGYDGSYLNTGGRYDPISNTWAPTSTMNAPSGRAYHTAVWTGDLMVVWGGADTTASNSLHTGGRYDPASDIWTPTSTANAPSGRYYHTSVWTGSLMIVWGGRDGFSFFNSGGRYDPLADTWTPTSATNAPSGRYAHTAVWTGSLMVVWGGNNGSFLETGGCYDPLADTWSPTSTTNAPWGRITHTAIWTGNMMVVWGGYDGFRRLNSGGRYDPVSDTWMPTSATSVPSERELHTAVWTGRVMVVWGGYDWFRMLDTGGRYDPLTDTWVPTSITNAPSGRCVHTALWTGRWMVVWGGFGPSYALNSGGLYDPLSDSWTPTSAMNAPFGRAYHTAVWTGSLMVVWGGWDGFTLLDSGGRYDPLADTWTPTSTMNAPSRRRLQTSAWTGSRMVVWGGDNGAAYFNNGGRYALGLSPDADNDGFSECDGDCDDSNPSIYPGAPELCDSHDNDCDGAGDPSSCLRVVASASLTEGPAPFQVEFSATVSGGEPPYTYNWDFDDGSAYAGESDPSHTYMSVGVFHPALTVTDSTMPPNVAADGHLTLSSLPSLTLIAPNGGETWQAGATEMITWTYIGDPGPSVRIDLLRAETVDSTIAASVSSGAGGTGAYTWAIPATQVGAADYRVRVTSTSDVTLTDASESELTIIGTVFRLLVFPLPNRSFETAKINSVFDHSMVREAGTSRSPRPATYCPDKRVVAYTGETGRRSFGYDFVTKLKDCGKLFGFKQDAAGTPFSVQESYEGDGKREYLYYDGHPGYDYVTTDQCQGGPITTDCPSGERGGLRVLAAVPGVVMKVSKADEKFGRIRLDHGNGYETWYVHLATPFLVSGGQRVSAGEDIGISGDSAGGPHLHFEVRFRGIPVDPYGWQGVGEDPYSKFARNQFLW